MSDAITSATPAVGRSLSGWLKGFLLVALVLVVSWGGAISYWRTTDHMPGTSELMLLLVGLPAFFLLSFWLTRKLLASRNPSSSSSAHASGQMAAAPEEAPPALAILAASLRLPHGTSPEELAAVIASNRARPDLDPELLDEDGFPVMTARSNDAVDEALQGEIAEWLEQNGMSSLNFSGEQWRALILATAVTEELAGYSTDELLSQTGRNPKLLLEPILPSEWTAEDRRAACGWLKHAAIRAGWPDKEIAGEEDVLESPESATPSAILERLTRDAGAADAGLLAIVVACGSNIGNETVERWGANGRLFTSSHTGGAIPGEGAAGLLVSDIRQAQSSKNGSFVVLDRMSEGQLESSADETKRIDPKLVCELTERALKRGRVDVSQVRKIVADTGHWSSRVLELMKCATMLPQLDEAEDVVQAGVSTGSCGDVPFIATLALAYHHALTLQSPVLAISNQDAYRRVATLVRPVDALS